MDADDNSVATLIIVLVLVAPAIAGFSLMGFEGGLTMAFLSLICLPVVMFFLGIGFFKRHEDIYG